MATPPSRLPTWATDGGADVTDPGTSKQATGWIESEAPAADHTNWLLNNQGKWIEFLADSMAPQMAINNFTRTDDQPWGAVNPDRYCIQYNEYADMWNAILYDGGVVDAWSSATGDHGTWTKTNLVASGATGTTGIALDTTDGTIYIGIDENIWSTATGDAQNLTDSTVNFASIDDTVTGDMVYDAVNDVLIATGATGATNHIETATPGGAWTSRANYGSVSPSSLVTGNGLTYAHASSVTSTYNFYSTAPTTTWTNFTAAFGGMSGVYCPNADIFLWCDNNDNPKLTSPADPDSYRDIWGNSVGTHLFSTPTLGLALSGYLSTESPHSVKVYNGLVSGNGADKDNLGPVTEGIWDHDSGDIDFGSGTSGRNIVHGSDGKIIWPYTGFRLAYTFWK